MSAGGLGAARPAEGRAAAWGAWRARNVPRVARMQQRQRVLWALDDPEPVRGAPCVQCPVRRLDNGPCRDRTGSLENLLCGDVVRVPVLCLVKGEEEWDAAESKFPGGVEARIVERGKAADGRREVAGIADRAVVGIWMEVWGM
jgi:hypothetical protein